MACWFFYFTSLDSPWKVSNVVHVAYAQKLWDKTFPNIKCTVALRNDPIFSLIKQWTYDWCSDLAARALQAVESFFNWYQELDSPKDCACYVKWAVPKVTESVDSRG
ncbi:hypothetical protein SCLCIDRAFT_131114 [Scleroderma citrinum Foug A]|uniref:Uncharacterized protein n=1 Tax=Scleroderma citrinum Foug A TaxID=1036808 RepID=A0A0C3DM85_9AGAM|nr:hypothetical protein SCLCIDRAFT_131114 [Scleroderma citrinum Foug A]